jgi:hypothetical protein
MNPPTASFGAVAAAGQLPLFDTGGDDAAA